MTQVGGRSKSGSRWPEATRARAMIPIVFWASFVPWVKATNAPDTSWARRNPRLTFVGDRRAMSSVIATISTKAIAMPRKGATSEGMSTLSLIPLPLDDVHALGGHRRADHPADQRVARARRQADEPGDEVPRDRPDQARENDVQRDGILVDDPLRDGGRDLDRDERAGEVEHRRARDRSPRAQRAGRDAGGDRVGGVVEPVREVEEQRDRDDGPERRLHGVRHAFFTTMLAIVFAAVSQLSSARSSRS